MLTLHVTKWALELDGASYALLSAIATLVSLEEATDLAENWIGGFVGRGGVTRPQACAIIFNEKGELCFRWIRPGKPERFDPPQRDDKFVCLGSALGECGSLLQLRIPLGTLPPATPPPTDNHFPNIFQTGLMGEAGEDH